jgi:hypothetical protein
MFNEPLGGKRYVSAREHRTKKDWAFEIHSLLTKHYPHAEKVILVMDNLNTHTIASLYEAFPADKALEMAQRLEIHFTPQTWELAEHGRDRVKRVEFPMLKPPDRQSIEAEERDPGVAARSEQE